MHNNQTYDEMQNRINELEVINRNLVANEKKFNSFFNHAGISICMVDPKTGQIIEFNDAAHENLGYTREEFGKLTIHDIDNSVTEASISDRRKENEKGTHIFETVHRTRNGDLKNMLRWKKNDTVCPYRHYKSKEYGTGPSRERRAL